MKVITLEVVLFMDDDFDPDESGTARLIVENALDHTNEYDHQAFKSIRVYNVNHISERDEDEDD